MILVLPQDPHQHLPPLLQRQLPRLPRGKPRPRMQHAIPVHQYPIIAHYEKDLTASSQPLCLKVNILHLHPTTVPLPHSRINGKNLNVGCFFVSQSTEDIEPSCNWNMPNTHSKPFAP